MENDQARELREAYSYATRFLRAFCEINGLEPVEPLPTLCGVLTQIDNATTLISKQFARLRKLERALHVPDVWSQIERDGLAEAFRLANGKHGHYETLFAVAAWLLRHRAALAGPNSREVVR